MGDERGPPVRAALLSSLFSARELQCRPPLPLLRLDPPAHRVTQPEHILIRERVVRERSFLAPRDEPRGRELLEMLGDIRLAESRAHGKLRDATLAVAQFREQLQ